MANKAWDDDPDHGISILVYHVMLDYEHLLVKIFDTEMEYKAVRGGVERSLVFVGDDEDHEDFHEYLELVFSKKHHEFSYFRIKKGTTLLNHKLYLYRKNDDLLLVVKGFPDWHDSMDFLYHHSDPHVLNFPQPALNQMIEHKNMGMILIFKKRSDLQEIANQLTEAAFEEAAEQLYEQMKFTKCYLEDKEC